MPPQDTPPTPKRNEGKGLDGFVYDENNPLSKGDQLVAFLKARYPNAIPPEVQGAVVMNSKENVVPFPKRKTLRPFDPTRDGRSGKDIAGNQGDLF